MAKKRLIVFTGAGISAESGIKTFRDSGGLWEEFRIEDVATIDAWVKNRELVLEFYNQRRKQVMAAKPNGAHDLIAELQTKFDVQVVTQNVDDLHERAGGRLSAFFKKDLVKIRPINNPSRWRRCAAHLINAHVKLDACAYFTETIPNFIQNAGSIDGAIVCSSA